MVKLSESELREMLEGQAVGFVMAPVPPEAILRKAGRRKARNVMLASVTTLVVVVLVALSVVPRGSDRGVNPAAGGNDAAVSPGSPSPTSGRLRLVDYVVRGPAAGHPHSRTGPRITVEDVRRHATCMRAHGFDVPEPSEQPGGGWAVIVDHPKAHGLAFSSRRFRQAWFVTCGPLGGPLSGDLVVGGPHRMIDKFISCMSRQGFTLPEPKRGTSGSYDVDDWQFDLTPTTIDTSTPAWNRAMFVTCAPDHF
jgi:hypothetical protein